MRALAEEAVGGTLSPARIGRGVDQVSAPEQRGDRIRWIDECSGAGRTWLAGCDQLRVHLNRTLMAGLFSFESHFAHYPAGAFYQRHVDAFRGQANRRVSLVAYLNDEWSDADGGQLVLYPTDHPQVRVTPAMGTLVVFLSEDLAHEVLPASRDRYSIAGWFRVNQSSTGRVDPPV
ncbi:2OG-Fe(II) oxygenase [Litorivicinus lipolyticus]|uniref:2OG-Fe(II) oxygenase n=2 Tax=Litorivicinus lipolyticus TaxID=418701 RepID=A0A5Q2QJI9_9GAMM|nr:2OG-Fe(II) oxygenase [Litorivicinus lipolyticus]